MDARDAIQSALDRWANEEVPLLPPHEPQAVADFFRTQLGFPLSSDVIALYSMTGGFVDGEMDDVWSLWSLERILKENAFNESTHLWFADYLISSYHYSFEYISPDISAVHVDHFVKEEWPSRVADSVAEFFAKYVTDPDAVEAFRIRDKTPQTWWQRFWGL